MGLNLTCPQCGQRMTLDFSTSRVHCEHCGYVRPDEIANLEKQETTVRAQGTAMPYVRLTYRGEVTPSAQAAFDTGIECLHRQDPAGAIQSFERALAFQPDFTDARLWIAKTTADPKVKRDHLETIVAETPNHQEAMRMLMVMNGRLTPEEAARLSRGSDGPEVRQAPGAVPTKSTELLCPNCGGQLTVDEQTRQVECRFCGYKPAPSVSAATAGQGDVLMAALLERKAKAVRWNVGKRLVKCQECGAEHTVPADHLADRCRFCGSMSVILSDALGSFEQPDGLIPAAITIGQAMIAIQEQLESLTERIKSFFDTNKVASSVIEGVYLPYWVFDASVEVTQIISTDMGTVTNTLQDGMWNVAVCASMSLPPALVTRLAPYDMDAVVPYEPRWLAKFPAQIYRKDFDAASLDARGIIAKTMRAKYEADAKSQSVYYDSRGREHKASVSVSSLIQTMSFRLLLLPVWIGLLTEADQDRRIALVNAQTGKAALGKPLKAPKRNN